MREFRVVQEPYGWSVRIGEGVTTPFRQRSLALQEAERLCASLRRHGERAEVVVEPRDRGELPRTSDAFSAARLEVLIDGRKADRS